MPTRASGALAASCTSLAGDVDSPADRIALVLAKALADVAADRGCSPAHLSGRVHGSLADALLEAYRLGAEDAERDATGWSGDRLTPVIAVPEQLIRRTR